MSAGLSADNDAPLRDSRGRDARIHGIVLDEGNPGPTLRELLRQWAELANGQRAQGDLLERTQAVLDVIGPDGTSVTPPEVGAS